MKITGKVKVLFSKSRRKCASGKRPITKKQDKYKGGSTVTQKRKGKY